MKTIVAAYKETAARADGTDPTGEDAVKAIFRRMAEISHLKAMMPTIKTPAKIGKRILSEADKTNFTLAVEVANRTSDKARNQAYGQAVVKATQEADSRFFEVVTEAMRQAKKAKEENMSAASAQAMLALVAKLELEQETDTLPTTREVSDRAYEIAVAWFSDSLLDCIAAPENKSAWSKARKAAKITYLPEARRGKGWQND